MKGKRIIACGCEKHRLATRDLTMRNCNKCKSLLTTSSVGGLKICYDCATADEKVNVCQYCLNRIAKTTVIDYADLSNLTKEEEK